MIVRRPFGTSLARPLAIAGVAVPLVALLVLGPAALPTALLRDFNAFYCAGRAVDAGADPYLAEPLGACERLPHGFSLQSGMPGLAMPAPLPPYALAPFALLAHLPYPAACLLWTLILAACVAATVVAMRRVTGLPWAALTAAFILTDGYASACLGQIAPVAIAAIALATAFAEARRGVLAGVAASFAMLEPHLGLASCLGLFVRVRGARVPLIGMGLAFAAISIVTAGPHLTGEYFSRVVSAHALSEVANEKQFSFTHLLYAFGVPEETALRAGEIQYALFVIAGVAAGVVLARRYGGDGLAVAIPAGFAIIGGPFIHVVQIAAGSIAALALYPHLTSARARRVLAASVILLAVPWMQFVNLGEIFPLLAALVAGVLAWTLFDARPIALGAFAGGAVLYLTLLENLINEKLKDPVPRLVAAYDPHALAEASWTLYVHLVATPNTTAYELAKAPTLLGALAIAGVAVAALVPKASAARRSIAVSAPVEG